MPTKEEKRKANRKAKNKRYYEKNKKTLLDKKHEQYSSHLDEMKASSSEYYMTHREQKKCYVQPVLSVPQREDEFFV